MVTGGRLGSIHDEYRVVVESNGDGNWREGVGSCMPFVDSFEKDEHIGLVGIIIDA